MNVIAKYRDMLTFIDLKDNLLACPSNMRSIIAGTLIDVANEHGNGICLLIENKLDVTAFSLLRVQFETFIRAAWLRNCASDFEIKTFINKDRIELDSKQKFSFKDMIIAVETSKNLKTKLSEIQSNIWKSLNSYTHGGNFQAAQRFNGKSIGPNHGSERVDDAVQISALLTFLGFCEMIEITENEDNLKFAKELEEQIKPWVF